MALGVPLQPSGSEAAKLLDSMVQCLGFGAAHSKDVCSMRNSAAVRTSSAQLTSGLMNCAIGHRKKGPCGMQLPASIACRGRAASSRRPKLLHGTGNRRRNAQSRLQDVLNCH